MPEDIFQNNLNNPEKPKVSNEDIIKELDEIQESEYLKKIKAKNKKYLIKLDYLEKERVAAHIKRLYGEVKTKQSDLSDKLDEYDDAYRMKPKTIVGTDENTPTYRSDLSTVTLEVIHANIMNVFFTPKDVLRVLPTESGDIPKIKKLDIFGNWSMKNEMELFDRCDRLFHSSEKNGETPYLVHWVKKYGTEIKREIISDPTNPDIPLLDQDTKEPLYQETEIQKILYNAPKLEILSRKDYILPDNARADDTPDWEMRKIRYTADTVKRYELEGRVYEDAFDKIGGWSSKQSSTDNTLVDDEGKEIPLGESEKLFVEFYGRLRINAVKSDKQGEETYDELEDEFIAVVELTSQTLCSLKKNRFPMKMRPIGLDLFMPDDEGRLKGTGVIEFMEGLQNCYDVLFNLYVLGVTQANSPFGFFSPLGNMKNEKIKIQHGYLFPTTDPNSVRIEKLPPPDNSIINLMEEVRNQAQMLFGISDYAIGIESQIDPSAPARKAELIVGQGNVRLNLIIKRKNQTLKDIFKRWFLLYKENMPPNKMLRIVGSDEQDPWKFEKINMTDFALNSIPDFELTGNILNANKTLDANKKLAIYNLMLANPFFNPQSQQGILSLHAVTKWLLDSLEETGISSFLPSIKTANILTPEEENARFLQGDILEPHEGEDHIAHIRTHTKLVFDPSVPVEVKKNIIEHLKKTSELLKQQVSQQIIMSQMAEQGGQGGFAGAGATAPNTGAAAGAGAPATAQGGGQFGGMGTPQGGNPPNLPQY